MLTPGTARAFARVGALSWYVSSSREVVLSCMLAWLRPVAAAAAALLAGLLAARRPQPPTVPLVNLTALALGDAAELATLRRAARSLGVFRVVGHGVDGASVINASKALFALPMAAKLATSTAAAGGAFQRGYIPLGSESGLADYFEVKSPSPNQSPSSSPSPSPNSNPNPNPNYLKVKEGFCYGYAHAEGEHGGEGHTTGWANNLSLSLTPNP